MNRSSSKRSRWYSRGRLAQYSVDLLVLCLSFILAYHLRFDFVVSDKYYRLMLYQLPMMVGVQWLCLIAAGAYRRIWRYISLVDLPPFLLAFIIASLPFVVLRLTVDTVAHSELVVPLSITMMSGALAFLGVLGSRILHRASMERADVKGRHDHTGRPPTLPGIAPATRVVLLGAGRAGVMAARELLQQSQNTMQVIGFLDDDPNKQGSIIAGLRVLGPTDAIKSLAAERRVDEAIITVSNAPRAQIKRLVQSCEQARIKTRIIPALHEILSGSVSITSLRPVQIEDLLGRAEVELDQTSMRAFITDKRIMVTGAGGSIGSEMVRQLFRLGPTELVMVDRSEFALYQIEREMRALAGSVRLDAMIGDITDDRRMNQLFDRFHPQVVVHAAAHKHVPMMEQNACEAMKNNALGTFQVADLAGRHGVEVFVLISTDKAVNPTSVMGSSKRLAEIAVQGLGERHPGTRYVAVRFGNVLGSTGSVIPLFREQIQRGGPVTVTHPEMKRYFMTIPEASRLVLQAAAIGMGGEIFVLDMGEPVNIADLARDMIRLSGLQPDEDIKIEYTGLRPGEKLFEELHTSDEHNSRTRHPMIFIGNMARSPAERVHRMLEELRALVAVGREEAVRSFITAYLPEAQMRDVVERPATTGTSQ